MKSAPYNGHLFVDKPSGMSSHTVVQVIRRLFGMKKVGHGGTLDPLATGLLPICLGEATKYSQYLLNTEKTYAVTAKLGVTTTSGDQDGEILDRCTVDSLVFEKLKDILIDFIGESEQIPPMYSALKHQGVPLYRLARQGKTVERKARRIMIHRITLGACEEDTFSFSVHCSKGTYIRTLVEEVGQALGVGAHIIALRRTGLNQFADYPMLTLAQLEQYIDEAGSPALARILLPIDMPMKHWPTQVLSESDCYRFKTGQAISIADPLTISARIVDQRDVFQGIAEFVEGQLVSRRCLAMGSSLHITHVNKYTVGSSLHITQVSNNNSPLTDQNEKNILPEDS